MFYEHHTYFVNEFNIFYYVAYFVGIFTHAVFVLHAGPVATTLSNRFSSQKVVFCGGIVLGVSAVLNGFAPNIYYLFFTHALLGGK
jgi:MFS family permease